MTDVRTLIREQLAKQMAPSKYRYPGTDAPIAIRLLTEGEVDNARLEAVKYAIKRSANVEVDPDFVEREVQRQIVWRATLEPEPSQGAMHALLFPADTDIRELDTVTMEMLFRLYVEHQETKSVTRHLADAEIVSLVQRVKKNPKVAARQFAEMDHATLVRVAVSFAEAA